MSESADFSLNTKIVNDDSCCYAENNHSTYFWESALAHQAKTQPQSISSGNILRTRQKLAVNRWQVRNDPLPNLYSAENRKHKLQS